MAAEAATPARADVVDEVFQERGITEPTPTPPAVDGVNNSFTLFLADEAGVPLPRASLYTSLYAGLRPRTRHEQRRSSLA